MFIDARRNDAALRQESHVNGARRGRFWSPYARTHQQLKSDVAVSIISAFREAGIEIPLPQQELHIKTTDSASSKAAAVEQGPLIEPQERRALKKAIRHDDGNP